MFHCTFCKNRDSSDLTYLTHTVRNEKGDTICPFLLRNKCDSCGEFGHTRKHCIVNNMSKLSTGNHNIHIATKCMMAMDSYIEDNIALTGDALMTGAIESCGQAYKFEMAKRPSQEREKHTSFQQFSCEFCGRNGHKASYCWIKNRYNTIPVCVPNEEVIVDFEEYESCDMDD